MARTPITRINPTAKEPFGPCLQRDGGLADEDFCKWKSGDRHVNAKCAACKSPFRLCKQCAMSHRRRLVLQPATGEALCPECLGLEPKPKPLPKLPETREYAPSVEAFVALRAPQAPKKIPEPVLEPEPRRGQRTEMVTKSATPIRAVAKSPAVRSTRRDDFAIASVSVSKKSSMSATEVLRVRGTDLLALKDDIDRRHAVTGNLSYISAQLKKPYTVVRDLYVAGGLSSELRDLIREHNLTLNTGFAILQYPVGLRAALAKTFGPLPHTPAVLRRTMNAAHYAGLHVLRKRLEKGGFVWPAHLNDDGTPKT